MVAIASSHPLQVTFESMSTEYRMTSGSNSSYSCSGSVNAATVDPSLMGQPSAGRSCVEPPNLVVERVALHRDAARGTDGADELLQLLLLAGGRAGGAEDLLPDEGALHVVGTEVERHLGDRERQRDPVRLDVRDVVEHQSRDGQHL